MISPRRPPIALAATLLGPLLKASEIILAVRAASFTVHTKADASPVTEADRRAEELLLVALHEIAPHIPIIAEEEFAAGRVPPIVGTEYFLVDALDGTKEFVRGGDDFTVNVALVQSAVPVIGLVAAPARGRAWFGALGGGAFALDIARPDERRPVAVRPPPAKGIDIVVSRSHREVATEEFIDRFPGSRVVAMGSSLKFCLLAEGKVDLYPRLAPTSQWDTAAGDAILRAAGGRMLNLDGTTFRYEPGAGAHAFLNSAFVATAGIDPFAKAQPA